MTPPGDMSTWIVYTEKTVFRNIYVYTFTYVHVISINEKGGHGFGGEQRGVYLRVWGKKRQREMMK